MSDEMNDILERLLSICQERKKKRKEIQAEYDRRGLKMG